MRWVEHDFFSDSFRGIDVLHVVVEDVDERLLVIEDVRLYHDAAVYALLYELVKRIFFVVRSCWHGDYFRPY